MKNVIIQYKWKLSKELFSQGCQKNSNITRLNYALERRTILCMYATEFHREFFKHGKVLSKRLNNMKDEKKNKGSVLVVESAYNSQNAHFGIVMKK